MTKLLIAILTTFAVLVIMSIMFGLIVLVHKMIFVMGSIFGLTEINAAVITMTLMVAILTFGLVYGEQND